jgi:hypothetical protein
MKHIRTVDRNDPAANARNAATISGLDFLKAIKGSIKKFMLGALNATSDIET